LLTNIDIDTSVITHNTGNMMGEPTWKNDSPGWTGGAEPGNLQSANSSEDDGRVDTVDTETAGTDKKKDDDESDVSPKIPSDFEVIEGVEEDRYEMLHNPQSDHLCITAAGEIKKELNNNDEVSKTNTVDDGRAPEASEAPLHINQIQLSSSSSSQDQSTMSLSLLDESRAEDNLYEWQDRHRDRFEYLLDSKYLSDINVRFAGMFEDSGISTTTKSTKMHNLYKGHRVILVAGSPVLAKMIEQAGKENKEEIVIWEPVEPRAAYAFLKV
jgi:hypothetical protein